jgi:Zn-dependent protease
MEYSKSWFYKGELKDIIIAMVVVTIVFSYRPFDLSTTISLVPYYFVAVLLAFLFHELAHRFVARRLGCVAFFKMWPQGIMISLLFMLIGFKFVAPGAVVILPYKFGRWGRKAININLTDVEMGLISVAGIAVNLFFAAFFSMFTGDFFVFIAGINAVLALFNLLPIPPLDGSKIAKWKPWVWLFLIIIAGILAWPYITGKL